MNYYQKYIKYKEKYLSLKSVIGGSNVGKEIFFKSEDTIRQGKIVEDVPPNYIIELEENKHMIRKSISKESEYKLLNLSSNINLDDINYTTNKFIIYFHDQCNDGITSAWIINKFLLKKNANFDNIEFIPIHASKENQGTLNSYDNKDSIVIFLDITPSIKNYYKLIKNNNRIIILDHHITSLKDFFPLFELNKEIIFDMNTSGAGLTWRTFFPDTEIPEFIKLVVKHDIYRQEDGDNTDPFFLIYTNLLKNVIPIENLKDLDTIIDAKSKKIADIEKKIETKKLPKNYLISPIKDTSFDQSIDIDVIGSKICLKKDLRKCGEIIEVNPELDGYIVKFITGEPELIKRTDIMFKETINTKYKKGNNYFTISTNIFEKFKRKKVN